MNRRGFLGTLLGLAFVPLAAKAAPKIEWSGALQAGVVNEKWCAIIHPAIEEELANLGVQLGAYSNVRWIRIGSLKGARPPQQDPQWYRAFAK